MELTEHTLIIFTIIGATSAIMCLVSIILLALVHYVSSRKSEERLDRANRAVMESNETVRIQSETAHELVLTYKENVAEYCKQLEALQAARDAVMEENKLIIYANKELVDILGMKKDQTFNIQAPNK